MANETPGELGQRVHEYLTSLANRRQTHEWNEAWEQCCQAESGRDESLLVRYGRTACARGNRDELRQCQATCEGFLSDRRGQTNVGAHRLGMSWALLKGTLRVIQASAARKLESGSDDRYLAQAATAFDEAFSRIDHTKFVHAEFSGAKVAERAFLSLLGETKSNFRCETWLLLTNPSNAIRLVVDLEPGETGKWMFDPLRLGGVDLGVGFLDSVRHAAEYVQGHWPWPAGFRLVLGFAKHQGVNLVDGPSGGMAIAACFRGAVERTQLDLHVAVSATLDPKTGKAGRIEGGDDKRLAARGVGCDQVLFHEETPYDGQRKDDGRGKLPRVDLIESFDQVWKELSTTEIALRTYRQAVCKSWDDRWASGQEESSPTGKPPFIADQGMKLLREVDRPRRFVGPSALAVQRTIAGLPGNAGGRTGDVGHWDAISREQVALDQVPDVTLRRLVIVNDAGLGKTTTSEWMQWMYSTPSSDKLALRVEVSRLAELRRNQVQSARQRSLYDTFVDVELLERIREFDANIDAADAKQLLRRVIAAGRVVLLFDGLDQAADDAVAALTELLPCDIWSRSRVILLSRPYALEKHWQALFKSPDEASDWRFVQLDEFTVEQQRRYLGSERFHCIPAEAREILTAPRVLYYLRKLTAEELRRVQFVSDVYHIATRHMILLALNAKDAAGMDVEEVERLLSMIAFHMVCDNGNFDAVSGVRPLSRLRAAICELWSAYAKSRNPTGTFDEAWVKNMLDKLAAMNEIIECGWLEHGCPDRYQFRNRSLQEYFAARFLASYCTVDVEDRIASVLYWESGTESRKFYNVWRMFAEMSSSEQHYDPQCWLTAARVLYNPSRVRGYDPPRRATEMIYQTWATVEGFTQSVEAEIRSQARSILEEYQGEFAEFLSWRRLFNQWNGWRQWRVARSLIAGFRPILAGKLQMGSPDAEEGRYVNEPQHEEELKDDFLMHFFPVTNAQYELFDPAHAAWRGEYSQSDDQPVIYVSWFDAWCFAKWISWSGGHARLPTEKEWEYSCRAGTSMAYWFGDEPSQLAKHAWYGRYFGGNAEERTYRLQESLATTEHANKWGLVDMHGNVWEWCADWYSEYGTGQDTSPPRRGSGRVYRGGCWSSHARYCRSSMRDKDHPASRDGGLGFRLAAVPSKPAKSRAAEPGKE